MKGKSLVVLEAPHLEVKSGYACYLCGKEALEFCDECGQPVCSDHLARCEYCKRKICPSCDY